MVNPRDLRFHDQYQEDEGTDSGSRHDPRTWAPWMALAWSVINTMLGILLISTGVPTSLFKICMGMIMMITSMMVLFEWLDYFSALQPHRQIPREEEDDDA